MRRMITWIAAAALLLSLGLVAMAHDVPKEDALGSVEVVVRYNGQPVSGGSVTCIRVGVVHEDDGNYSFRRLDGEELADIQLPGLAEELRKFAKDQGLTGDTLTVGSQGTAVFRNLELGLYLIVQETPAKGYNAWKPFLVSVPYMEDGVYVYDITAQVKSEVERVAEVAASVKPTTPDDPKLPQTGQLNWPVPLLVLLGLALFSAGWMLRFSRQKNGNGEET